MDNLALSIVLPCYNEEGNLRPLFQAVHEALDPLQLPYEIIVTDDGSTDGSWATLKECAARDPRIRGLRLARHCGQSAALWAGIKAARGRYIITLDSDLQNDPRDVPAFLKALETIRLRLRHARGRPAAGGQLGADRLLARSPTGCATNCPAKTSRTRAARIGPSSGSAWRG